MVRLHFVIYRSLTFELAKAPVAVRESDRISPFVLPPLQYTSFDRLCSRPSQRGWVR